MKYADCQIGMRVIVRDPDGKEPDRIGTIEKLHPILKLSGALPPGAPPFFTNFVSVRYDVAPKEKTPMGIVPITGVTVDPKELEALQ